MLGGRVDLLFDNLPGSLPSVRAGQVKAVAVTSVKRIPELPDVPTNFSGFRPENFDKSCAGEVTIERALTYSLNIPAVRVLAEVGVPNFTDKLREAGFTRLSVGMQSAVPKVLEVLDRN